MTKISNAPGKHTWNYKHTVKEIGGVSLTQPDQSFTIPELMSRFTNAIDKFIGESVAKQPLYENGDFDSPDMEKLYHEDMHDRRTFVENLQREAVAYAEERKRKKAEAEKLKQKFLEATEKTPQKKAPKMTKPRSNEEAQSAE